MRTLFLAASFASAAAACGHGLPISTAGRFDAEAKEREASRAAYTDAASPAFTLRFAPLASVSMRLSAGTPRPNACAATPGGDVYFANSAAPDVWRWAAGARQLSRLPLRPAPEHATALAWSAGEGLLYVLDGKRHEVLAYTPGGELRHVALLNAGQAAGSLALLDGGRLAVGGARWESRSRVTLLALHSPAGQLERALLPLDTAVLHNSVQMSPPLLVSAGTGRAFAAEPTSPRIRALSPDGTPGEELDAAYEGYRAPPPLRLPVPTFDAVEAWNRSWDPLVLVHPGEHFTYAVFQIWAPRHKSFRVEVFDPAGRRVATGLRHDSRPLCGAGDTLVLASSGDPRSVTLTRFADRGAEGGAE